MHAVHCFKKKAAHKITKLPVEISCRQKSLCFPKHTRMMTPIYRDVTPNKVTECSNKESMWSGLYGINKSLNRTKYQNKDHKEKEQNLMKNSN